VSEVLKRPVTAAEGLTPLLLLCPPVGGGDAGFGETAFGDAGFWDAGVVTSSKAAAKEFLSSVMSRSQSDFPVEITIYIKSQGAVSDQIRYVMRHKCGVVAVQICNWVLE